MKLRNKKTGEIADLSEGFIRDTYNGEMIQIKPVAISNKEGYVYGSLAELNADWEDYEEPKEYWYINASGDVSSICEDEENPEDTKVCIEIGNYFETKEEAELAVRKLKAAKRLKDKGFRFIPEASHIEEPTETKGSVMFIACTMNDYHDFVFGDNADIKLLFGGEE